MRPFSSRVESTKKSRGCFGQPFAFTSGKAGLTGATNAQCFLYSAPSAIHSLRSLFSSGLKTKLDRLGGILNALVASNNGSVSSWQLFCRTIELVQAQICHNRLTVMAMTSKALRYDRPNISVVINFLSLDRFGVSGRDTPDTSRQQ